MSRSVLVGYTKEGFPIYRYEDRRAKCYRYFVTLPNGTAFLSDEHGNIGHQRENERSGLAGAFLGGIIGMSAGGGPGAILGAAIGAAVEGMGNKKSSNAGSCKDDTPIEAGKS